MRVKLLGKTWELRFCRLRTARGDCDAPDTCSKEIRIHNGLRDEELLEVIIHECRHAADWRIDESYIEREARDLARVLWRLGYRRDYSKTLPTRGS